MRRLNRLFTTQRGQRSLRESVSTVRLLLLVAARSLDGMAHMV